MSEEKELKYRNQDSSALDDVTFPEEADELYDFDYSSTGDSRQAEKDWENCRETLEEDEESVEFLLDHREDRALMMPGADPEELEENYGPERYQVMGRRRQIESEDEYEWEPIRDLSGPSDGEKAAANLVSGSLVSAGRMTEASFKTVFEIMSALAD